MNKKPDTDPEKIKRICVFSWGRLGDVFIRIPIIEALKDKYPDSDITVVTDPGSARAISPACTRYSSYPFRRISKFDLKTIASNIYNIYSLRKQKFDLSIDLYGGGSSPVICRLVNARVRLAFDHRPKLRAANNLLAPYPTRSGQWSQTIGSMLSPLGINAHDISTDTTYYCETTSRNEIASYFTNEKTKYIGINLGASTMDKAWPVENYVRLLNSISGKIDITPVVFFNPGQAEISEQFISLTDIPCISLNGLDFEHEAAALEQCDILLTADTALMHLATGVKTPVFAFFLQTRPEYVQPALNPFFACMVEDINGKPVNGLLPVISNIPVKKAVDDFINFTSERLQWLYTNN
jgi:ADP-heptose:LPS heptosyltransferase